MLIAFFQDLINLDNCLTSQFLCDLGTYLLSFSSILIIILHDLGQCNITPQKYQNIPCVGKLYESGKNISHWVRPSSFFCNKREGLQQQKLWRSVLLLMFLMVGLVCILAFLWTLSPVSIQTFAIQRFMVGELFVVWTPPVLLTINPIDLVHLGIFSGFL